MTEKIVVAIVAVCVLDVPAIERNTATEGADDTAVKADQTGE